MMNNEAIMMMNKRGNHEHVAPKERRGCFLCPQNGEEVVPTLETYFAKPQTVDWIRARCRRSSARSSPSAPDWCQ
jgi:hypothetical protein